MCRPRIFAGPTGQGFGADLESSRFSDARRPVGDIGVPQSGSASMSPLRVRDQVTAPIEGASIRCEVGTAPIMNSLTRNFKDHDHIQPGGNGKKYASVNVQGWEHKTSSGGCRPRMNDETSRTGCHPRNDENSTKFCQPRTQIRCSWCRVLRASVNSTSCRNTLYELPEKGSRV